MQRSFMVFFLFLSGCSLKLEPSLNPNIKFEPKVDPNVIASHSNDATTSKSRSEAAAGIKQKSFNIWWSSSLLSSLGIDGSKNCVQLVYLSTGELVVDGAAVPCPANDGLLNPNSILFTLIYKDEGNNQAKVFFLGREVGKISYDWDFPAAQMDLLQVTVSGGMITGIH